MFNFKINYMTVLYTRWRRIIEYKPNPEKNRETLFTFILMIFSSQKIPNSNFDFETKIDLPLL